MGELLDEVKKTADFVRTHIGKRKPTVGLILGSGLGNFATKLQSPIKIPYSEIPGFPVPNVAGHAGYLWCGSQGRTCVLALQGRKHPYEGTPMRELVLPVRTLIELGAKTIIVTAASGALNQALLPGDLMLMKDHINLLGRNPLVGPNEDDMGPRFPAMGEAYSKKLQRHAMACAEKLNIQLRRGVYVAMLGPTYETPAEAEMLRRLGGDAAGMSTVHEVIAIQHMAQRESNPHTLQVLGITLITNVAGGALLSHEDVLRETERAKPKFMRLLSKILYTLPA